MAVILCVETSSTNCSVALASDELNTLQNDYNILSLVDLLEDNSDSYSHGERLHVYIKELLDRNDLSPTDLSAIAVSAGPGSYTGLRIGVAAVKGMCYALGIPMIAISTLQALALQARPCNTDMVIPMLDARRMEVYTAVYDKERTLLEPTPMILDTTSFDNERSGSTVVFIGSGVQKFNEILPDSPHHFTTAQPTALTMCDLALEAHKKNDIVDVAYFEPLYLKEFKVG